MSKSTNTSVIIIHHNRLKNLQNVLLGISQGSVQPDEIIIVNISKKLHRYYFSNLNLVNLQIVNYNENSLPIARAKNLGASRASNENLIFLDVDCIPSNTFIERITQLTPLSDGIYMGTPRYLKGESRNNQKELIKNSALHPTRPYKNHLFRCEDYRMFWSSCFFISSKTFNKIGGFDENYTGYGAEDNDFAFTTQRLHLPFFIAPFEVFHHQYSPSNLPLNHLESIVNNANLFYSKWKLWPMENYLQELKSNGFVGWEKVKENPIKILRKPSTHQIELALVDNRPYA